MRYAYLHGFASGPESSKGLAIAAHLARTRGVEVARPNLRQPSFEHLRGNAMIEHVEALIGGEPTLLIGSSLGGWVSLRVAERRPNVVGLVLLAPAIGLAESWKRRLPNSVDGWRRTGWLPVEDHANGGIINVDIGFLDDVDAIDAAGAPEVSVPTVIIHGRRDDVVPISGSARWAAGKANVRLVEVDDDHQLSHSLATIFAEIDAGLDAGLDARRGAALTAY